MGRAPSAAQLKQTLRRVFGVRDFRPGQEAVIRAVLEGRDTLAVMPTGHGKSLCYQLPALHLDGVTLVISPLISLMKDQIDKLEAKGLDASQLNSGLTKTEEHESLERLQEGSDFVFTTPERLAGDEEFQRQLARQQVARVVVDEAHCVSQWGHDFRPAFLDIRAAVDRLGRPPILALTATATSAVADDIVAALGLSEPRVINTGIFRPNLRFEVLQTASEHSKREHLADLMRNRDGSAIVYTATVKDADAVHTDLKSAGVNVGRYHGKMPRAERRENQDAFMSGRVDVIVATNAFGMGIDRADIRAVIHYSIPGSLEAYYQEAGRAGRDGEPSRCVLLFNATDRKTHAYFIARLRDRARRPIEMDKLDKMIAYGQHPQCRWRVLLEYFGERVDDGFRCGACDICANP